MNYTGVGLNTDSVDFQIKKGQLTFANNAVVESWDGKLVTYQNERSNYKLFEFKDSLRPIGIFHITEINRVVYFLTDNKGKHQIAYTDNEANNYKVLIESSCLNFSVDHPIHQIVKKTTNCGIEIYWTDAYNNMRYLNFEDLPFKEIPDPNNDYKRIKIEGEVDCNKLLAQPNFRIPKVESSEVVEGGTIVEGSYQFVIQYANSLGQGYSQFYNPSNPISIGDSERASLSFNLPTSKAIRLNITKLDTSGIFDYFNLVVIENVNAIATPKLVGTYPITSESYEVLYTGNTNQAIQLSMEELFQKYLKYDVAGGVTVTDSRIVWYDLKENHRVNYQDMVSRIPLYWEDILIPYNDQNGYKNALNTEKYKGMMRDEIYPFEMVILTKNGKESDRFPFVGRLPSSYDLETVNNQPRWKHENTATLTQTFTPEPYKPYRRGNFAYWQSEERYPNNQEIWGQLSSKNIRYHKFPDEIVSSRFVVIDDIEYICPIGVKIFKQDVINAIAASNLTQSQKEDIVGFKVVRGDRTSGNSSIVAKGHFTNVGKYEEEENTYYFSNYPYNDLGDDPLFARNKISPGVGYSPPNTLRPFENNPLNRLTFHSPDTHFSQPFGVDSGYVKLEAVDYGKSRTHFVKIDNNAEYKFLTKETLMVSVGLAAGVAFDYTSGGKPEFNGTDAMNVFQSNMQLFEKLAPYTNFGYNINSIATFNDSVTIPNTELKKFTIEFGKYLNSEFNTIDQGNIINNKYRESSVFVKLDNEVKPAHEYSDEVPIDDSRVIGSEKVEKLKVTEEEFFTLLKNEDTTAVASLTLGFIDESLSISEGSDNMGLVLLPIMSRMFQNILDTGSIYDINQLKDRQLDCNTAYCHNTMLSSGIPANIPQVSNVSFDIFLPYSQIQDVYETRLDIEATSIVPTFSSVCSNQDLQIQYFEDNFTPTPAQVQQGYSFFNPPPTDADAEEVMLNQYAFILLNAFGLNTVNICGGKIQDAVYRAFLTGIEYYSDISTTAVAQQNLNRERERNVNAYYGAIKRELPAQWGRVHSYDVVDTGIYYELADNDFPTIFGGDTFINKFSFKTKMPVFRKTTVGTPSGSDIALDEEGNLGDPMFWISTQPLDYDFQFNQKDLELSLGGLGLTNIKAYVGSVLQTVGGVLLAVGGGLSVTIVGSPAGVIVAAIGGILTLAGVLFKNTRSKLQKASINLYKSLFQQIIEKIGIKNLNLDLNKVRGITQQGIIYQYVYGIPTYFVESQVNVDLRQATNDREGNYYPRVGTNIPDDWLQENNVSIQFDNVYHYNKTFSKQNKENFYSYLREDYDFSKLCFREFPNRAMWSDKTNLNETLNNWLIYRPLNQFDFPKEYGKLTALNGILNRQVLARFENKSQLYNTLTTLNADTIKVYVGSDELFKNSPPLDMVDTDNGSMGSQHKWLMRTEMGIVYIDSMRGQVVLLQGNNPKILSDIDNEKFFKENLPFYILKHFPDFPIDNHFKDVGLHGVYDSINRRIIITKLDYEVLDSRIITKNGKFYLGADEVLLENNLYFCNRSWSMSFSFRTNSWVSYHSYTPNSYVSFPTYFQSLQNGVWNHEKTFNSFCEFYGKQEPYILEYPFVYKQQDEILQSISDFSNSLRYTDLDTYYEPDEVLYFNKAFVRNKQQNSGMLNLIPRPIGNMSAYLKYPKYNTDSKDIMISKKDGIVNFNTLWDITKDSSKPTTKIGCNKIDISLDQTNLNYAPLAFKKAPLRSKELKIRLIRDTPTDFKLVSNFVVTQTQTSFS